MTNSHMRKLRHPGQLLSGKTPLVVHASEDWHDKIRAGQIDFFETIAARAGAHGHKPLLVAMGSLLSRAVLETDHRQIVIGKLRPRGATILHAHPSYLWGFWYLDPCGYYWHSSLVERRFDPGVVDDAQAEWFFNGVAGHMTRKNVSKLPQPARGGSDLAPAAAVVFLQQIDGFKTRVHHVDTLEMIEQTARGADGTVYVKLHPVQSDDTRAAVLALCADLGNVEVTAANVHDLIAISEVTVTQNSATGFEALMQRKPVITCARIDYHHATVVARSGPELRRAVRTAPQMLAGFPYEKYLYWFLHENMLEPRQPAFAERAWTRLLAAGAPDGADP